MTTTVITEAEETGDPSLRAPRQVASHTVRDMRLEDERLLRDWVTELAGDAPVRIAILRMKPKSVGGRHIGGTLETVHEIIDEDYIRERWGGGSFQLKISTKRDDGRWHYFKATTIEIAGDPLMEGRPVRADDGPQLVLPPGESEGLQGRAMDMLERAAEKERARADRLERERNSASSVDPALLEALTAPLRAQIDTISRQNAELQRALSDVVNRPAPKDEFRDRMMDRLVDQDSARITALREQFDSEVRMLKQSHADDVKELRRAHEREIDRLEKQHEREISLIRSSSEINSKVLGSATEIRSDAHQREIERLGRELTKAETELAALRAKKDKGILESARELKELKEALVDDAGDEPAKDAKWWEKGLEIAGKSPALMRALGFAGDDGGGGEHHPMPAELPESAQPGAIMPAVGVPFAVDNSGRVFVRQPDDQIVEIDLAEQRRARAAAKRGQRAAREPAAGPPPPQVDPDQARLAVGFMEGALQNGTSPEAFAQSARSMVPGSIIAYISQVGVDEFLQKVARLGQGSPLNSQHGRNWARAVAKCLIEGTA